MRARIFLVRHGATAANRAVPYTLQGSGSDLELDVLGQEQARRAGEALRGLQLDAFYSSPLRRAIQTAHAIAEFHGRSVEPVADMIEGNVGRWEGLTWDQARSQDPEHHARFMELPGVTPYPHGESFADVSARASRALRDLAERHAGQAIVVVGHNIVNRAVLAAPLGLSIDQARSIRQANGGINVLDVENGRITVECVNACLHLMGTN